MEGGPPCFPQDFSCPVVLRVQDPRARVRRLRGSHPLRRGVPDRFGCPRASLQLVILALQPPVRRTPLGLGSSRFARHYSGNLTLISFPRGTEMFQFPRFPAVTPMHSAPADPPRGGPGCPIRIRTAHRSLAAPRPRFAALRVLLRPLAPRHPPNTLDSLTLTHLAALSCRVPRDRGICASRRPLTSAKLKQSHTLCSW